MEAGGGGKTLWRAVGDGKGDEKKKKGNDGVRNGRGDGASERRSETYDPDEIRFERKNPDREKDERERERERHASLKRKARN